MMDLLLTRVAVLVILALSSSKYKLSWLSNGKEEQFLSKQAEATGQAVAQLNWIIFLMIQRQPTPIS
jgi:hypothetical protein